jgi:4-amino-4-deoxychorismate lyase
MCLLLETIQIREGEIMNPVYHNRRFNESRRHQFGSVPYLDLVDLIRVPAEMKEGVCRCRVLYREEIAEIQFSEHKEIPVHSLKLIRCDDIDYSLKYADRDRLTELYEQKGDCDDILIIKNGLVTDTYISNIILRRNDGRWITPDSCLLKGTMRTFLLETGKITEERVRPEDLSRYTGARMINCMRGFDSTPVIQMERIRF